MSVEMESRERELRRRWAIVRHIVVIVTDASILEVAVEAGLPERAVFDYYLKRIELERES